MSDLRATLRQLRQSPAHLAACLLSLSAGMAICVAVFSALNAMRLGPIAGVTERRVLDQIPGVGDRREMLNVRGGDGSVAFSPAEACVALLFLTGLAVRS